MVDVVDVLEELECAAVSDTAPPWMTEVLRRAVTEIVRLRAKNTELNRRSQKAEAAARDTYVEAQRHGVSFGRILANYMARIWRDLAVVLADEMACQMAGRDDDRQEDHIGRMVGPGGVIGIVARLLADGETIKDEAFKARGRLEDTTNVPRPAEDEDEYQRPYATGEDPT